MSQSFLLQRQSGASILEAMVALVVLSLGAIGVAGVQLSTVKFNQVSQQRSVAVHHLVAMTDRMRSNMPSVRAGDYIFNVPYANIPSSIPAFAACGAPCTSQQVANRHLNEWLTQLAGALPSGRGAIVRPGGAGTPFLIAVMWEEKDLTAALRDARCDDFPIVAAPPTAQCIVAEFQP
ncbi:type IV pilus modification protein PilV [Piscinibacterium candidicorallinum]|jgi:type IV pilus assembly protein PilV|uniref:Type IV pilus modification protein PilV n=1 Tax=Piscinibacterium candidicorallinum TaxID=1793872 RepID=A0ABV7HAT5_9BURK